MKIIKVVKIIFEHKKKKSKGEVEAIEGDERRTVAVTLSTMTFVPTE